MKKVFFAFVAASVVVLSSCNNKPAETAPSIDTTSVTTVVETTTTVDTTLTNTTVDTTTVAK